MELAFSHALFTRLADGPAEGMVELLEDAAAVLDDRTRRLKGRTRLHTPTVEEPLILIVVDKLASLTAYLRDRDLKRRVDSALQQLLTKGRAPGVTVVGALQDPRKEVLTYRDLFPARVALRLTEREQVGMVLGDSAWHHGAHCERIPTNLPGVGYVLLDGRGEPVRVRAGHVTDVDLDTGTLRVAQTLQRLGGQLRIEAPKTSRSRRTIALPDFCVTALRQHEKAQEDRREDMGELWRDFGLVFTTGIGTPIEPRNLTRSFNALCDRAGLRRVRFHDLRHSCASLLLALGVEPRVVMEVLGHSAIAVTMNTYTHVMPAMRRDAAARMDRAFGS